MTDSSFPPLVWDRWIRFFHWSSASLFFANYFVLEGGSDIHNWAGYALLVLLILRLGWGVIGSQNARLKTLWHAVTQIFSHLRSFSLKQVHSGHSPLGSLMVFALWSALLIAGLSGWMSEWDMFWGEDWVQDLHEYSADTLLALVILHVSAVLLIQRVSRVNLIRGMITGRRSSR